MHRWLHGVLVLVCAFAGGCEPVSGTDSASGTGDVPEAVGALYAPLPAASPGVLKGVWSVSSANGDGSADVRFRFADGKITAGVRCVFPTRGETLLAGDETSLAAPELTQGSGSFRLGESLSFAKTKGDLDCRGQLAALSWSYVIQGTQMTLAADEATGSVLLTKVGD